MRRLIYYLVCVVQCFFISAKVGVLYCGLRSQPSEGLQPRHLRSYSVTETYDPQYAACVMQRNPWRIVNKLRTLLVNDTNPIQR